MNGAVKRLRSIGEILRLKEFNINIKITDIIYLFMCYISSACTVADGRTPFALSVYAAAFSGRGWFVFLPVTISGIIRYRMDFGAVVYIAALVIFTVAMSALKPIRRYKSVALGISLVMVLMVSNAAKGFSGEDFVWDMVEALSAAGAVIVFEKAVNLIANFKERKCISDFDVIVLGVFISVLVRTSSQIPLIFGVDVSAIIAIAFLMILNLKGDTAVSVTVGILCAIALWDNGAGVAATVGIYVMSSFMANILKGLGRWGCILGFVLINTAYVSFLPSEILPFDIFEIVFATVIYLIIPRRFTELITAFGEKRIYVGSGNDVINDKNKKIITYRLQNLANSYRFLAHSYKKSYTPREMSGEYIIKMLDVASSKICPDCGLKYNCWERGYKESYKSMLKMLEKAEEKGAITVADIQEPLKQKCIKPKDFTDSFNKMYNVYKVEKIWQNKINDCRQLVLSQLEGVVKSVERISEEINLSYDMPAERELSVRLDEEKIDFENIDFLMGKDEDFTVDITLSASRISPKEEATIISVLKELTGTDTSKIRENHCVEGLKVTFKPTRKYIVTVGTSMVPKAGEKVSGDSTVLCENAKGEIVAALSDAMGAGIASSKESEDAMALLKNFMNAGIESSTAVELINSALLLRSSPDIFVTMDMCVVNPMDGNAMIIKSGASPGYIKNSCGVSVVRGNSLPFGTLREHDDISTDIFNVGKNALVIMVSDGISEIFATQDSDILKGIIEVTDTTNPQIMASVIMKQALKQCDNKPKDDMTVMVVNIQQS